MIIMIGYNKLVWACALTPALVGCVDEIDTTSNFSVDKPESVAQYEYLADYAPLKSYVDRAAHPGFLLGTGVSADEYLKRGGVYVLTNSNFDQVTTGNAMKHASVMGDNGYMDFTTVKNFVEAATSAGLEVYGHTLCWHEQQRYKYLNGLLADRIPEDDGSDGKKTITLFSAYDGQGGTIGGWGGGSMESIEEDGKPCFKFTNDEEKTNPWDIQINVQPGDGFGEGVVHTIEFDVKGTPDATFTWDFQCSEGYQGRGATDPFNVTADWTHVKLKGTPNGAGTDRMLLSVGKYVGTLYISNLVITYEGKEEKEVPVSLIINGNGATSDVSCFFGKTGGADPTPAEMDGNTFKVELNANPSQAWDAQFFIKSTEALAAGTKLEFSMMVKCTDKRTCDIQAHQGTPGNYKHYNFVGSNFTTVPGEWVEYKWSGVVPSSADGCDIVAFNLTTIPDAGTMWFKDIVWNKMVPGNAIPLTPDEKREIIDGELNRWVKGMMEATEGKVKAWDVLNEVLSGADKDGDGKYDLNGAANWTGDKVNERFFWADYLGKDFVRDLVKYARDGFKDAGGNPDELKLFINDFNLESWWDNNGKAKSLVEWIKYWESDNLTKIDGIGTQMHVSYCMKPEDQKTREDAIVEMFKVLAKSGKLIRITELDMGILDADGNTIKTPDLTFEQKKLMSDYYKFIVKKYFEIIPVAQQYGICAWAQTDSPEGSGWRAGEPIGLWDADYSRKPAYGGFADGLAGKE